MKLNIFKKRLNRDDFSSQITKLVIPIVLQNLLSASVNSADVIMLNFVGQSSISAVSLAAQYTSILFMVFFGLGTGASILTAQYFGKNDFKAIAAIQGIALRFSISFSILFGVAALTIPELMMLLFTKDPELIEIGASYLRILSISFFCCGIVEIYLSVLRSVSRVVVSTALNTFAFTSNILLNAVFIFGLFGAPKLGAVGVAIATSLSRLMELILCFIVSAASRNVKLDFKAIFIRNKLLFKDFIRLSLPALGNDIVWGVGFSMYSVIIGHMSSDAVAANSFVVVVRNFGTILCFGFSSAGGILLGQLIGENKLEQAALYAKKLLKLTVITGAGGGLIVLGAIPVLMNFASLNETGMHYLKYMLLINTYYVMGAAVNTTLIVGAFRAGGDSRFGFICDLIDMWVYAVPLGFFAAFVLKLPVLWVYFLLCTDEFVKWPWVIRHYRSGKWLKNITRDNLFDETPNTDSVSVG